LNSKLLHQNSVGTDLASNIPQGNHLTYQWTFDMKICAVSELEGKVLSKQLSPYFEHGIEGIENESSKMLVVNTRVTNGSGNSPVYS